MEMICIEVSIEHADGSTECMDPECELAHELHDFHLACSALNPPCPCVPEEHVPPAALERQPQPEPLLVAA